MAARIKKYYEIFSLKRTFQFSKITILSLLYLVSFVPSHSIEGKEYKVCKKRPIFDNFLNLKCREKFGISLIDFDKWEFEENNLLYETFPLDLEKINYCRKVRKAVFSYVEPVLLKTRPSLVAISTDVLENILDIESDSLKKSEKFLQFVSGNILMKNSVPLAHRYGGHQFGEWAGQLGDGRAVLLGDYVNRQGERWELQLKGSGKTPYSRRGDGRAVLRSSIREFLASEAMHHLGIPTSRAASIIVSKDPVWRDMFYDGNPKQEPAAIVLRVAKSWFRIGSLEIMKYNGEIDLLKQLVDFMINQHFGDTKNSTNKYIEFFSKVVTMTADMVAKWQSVGFAHGVCNTDNFSLLSITIDYGPFGFLDRYSTDFVPNSSDDEGRYSFRNQPSIGFYNLDKLLDALSPLIDQKKGKPILMQYPDIFNDRFLDIYREKLGLLGKEKQDEMLIKSFLWLMESSGSDYTMSFRQLADVTRNHVTNRSLPRGSWALEQLAKNTNWFAWLRKYWERLDRNGRNDTHKNRRHRMNAINPRYILRNWIAQSAIDKAENQDYTEVQRVLKILQNPYTEQIDAETAGFASPPPPWASKLRVSCSS